MSYIVKNCPAIYGIDDGFLCSYREDDKSEKYCYDCPDCVMKQIVELCRDEQKSRVATNILSNKILKLLDLQEIE